MHTSLHFTTWRDSGFQKTEQHYYDDELDELPFYFEDTNIGSFKRNAPRLVPIKRICIIEPMKNYHAQIIVLSVGIVVFKVTFLCLTQLFESFWKLLKDKKPNHRILRIVDDYPNC